MHAAMTQINALQFSSGHPPPENPEALRAILTLTIDAAVTQPAYTENAQSTAINSAIVSRGSIHNFPRTRIVINVATSANKRIDEIQIAASDP
mmetsp:Transcript_29052/g.40824  ORF Transcript_29052/g.40824 Transcript_29052/m.40824 type:complete len:93 (-) Transcript_29052:83-361(-)